MRVSVRASEFMCERKESCQMQQQFTFILRADAWLSASERQWSEGQKKKRMRERESMRKWPRKKKKKEKKKRKIWWRRTG